MDSKNPHKINIGPEIYYGNRKVFCPSIKLYLEATEPLTTYKAPLTKPIITPWWIKNTDKNQQIVLFFLDKDEITKAALEWNNFPEPFQIPDNLKGLYEKIKLGTSFAYLEREKIIENNIISIWDFNRLLNTFLGFFTNPLI